MRPTMLPSPRLRTLSRSLLPCFLLWLGANALASATFAGAILVTTTEPSHETECTLLDAVTAAIEQGSEGNCIWDEDPVVKLEKGKTYRLPRKLPNITSTVTIEGDRSFTDPAIITFDSSAPVSRRFAKVTGVGFLKLRFLVLEGGNRSHGGAFRVDANATLDATRVTFRSNSSADYGGAIWSQGTVLLQFVTFESNTAAFGGALANVAGTGALEAQASLWVGNSASSGGAIYQEGDRVEVKNSTFSANQAWVGGVVYNKNGASSLDLVTLRNNQASDVGSAIFAEYGTVDIRRSALTAEVGHGVLCHGVAYLSSGGNNATSDGSCALSDPTDQNVEAPIAMSELVDHGGFTRVHVPLCDWSAGTCGSPLIDQYACCGFGETCAPGEESFSDQRWQFDRRSAPNVGWAFSGGDACDIGAYESICGARLWGTEYNGMQKNTVWLHSFQNSEPDSPARLIDHGGCFSHGVDFGTAQSGCRVEWKVYGPRLKIQSILFLTTTCTEDCFSDPDSCAANCAGSPPLGWNVDSSPTAGTAAYEVPSCNPPAESRRYLIEVYDELDPDTTWWEDPETPVEIEI